MTGVSANRTVLRPSSPVSVRLGGMFEMTVRSCGADSVTSNTALAAGSSQHGNARRASVASNWVTAMCRLRPSTRYSLR